MAPPVRDFRTFLVYWGPWGLVASFQLVLAWFFYHGACVSGGGALYALEPLEALAVTYILSRFSCTFSLLTLNQNNTFKVKGPWGDGPIFC